MKTALKIIVAIVSASVLSSCSLLNGIDSLIPRPVIPINKVFVIELQYQNRPVIKKEIRCEKYYNAMWAERGNYWAIREVGSNKEGYCSGIEIVDDEIGTIIFPTPYCDYLVNNNHIDLTYLPLKINGQSFRYQTSKENFHTYKKDTILHNDGIERTVSLQFTYKVNGTEIR